MKDWILLTGSSEKCLQRDESINCLRERIVLPFSAISATSPRTLFLSVSLLVRALALEQDSLSLYWFCLS